MKPDAINPPPGPDGGCTRRVQEEWLDRLPPTDIRAIRSRRDLRRVNKLMGHANILTSRLRKASRGQKIRLVELGSGDGTFLLRLARQMQPVWTEVEAELVDQQLLLNPEMVAQFSQLGWSVRPIQADVLDWLPTSRAVPRSVMIANLFLHHFEDGDLARLFEACALRCELFVACEPRRTRFSLWAGRLLRCIGCNDVTRHDAIISVRAGFQNHELSHLWPSAGHEWRVEESTAGLFSHCFCARRCSEIL